MSSPAPPPARGAISAEVAVDAYVRTCRDRGVVGQPNGERYFAQMNLADGRLQVPPVEVTAQLAGSHTGCCAEVLAPYESRVYRWPASSAQDRGA